MKNLTRRNFIKGSLASAATAGVASQLLTSNVWAQARGANDDIRVAVVGIGNKGRQHVRELLKHQGVRLVAVSDADTERMEKRALKYAREANQNVQPIQDFRRILDDKSIDAIVTATPNHWHALVTIWACQAGKDVYVEKPVSHNVWEGKKMIEAARKYNRIVQSGTQLRSDTGLRQVIPYIQQGNLGKIKLAHCLCYNYRGSIGKVAGPQPIPATVDYNLWCGPAPLEPLRRKKLHYDWHWVWSTGNGDLVNQAIHDMDLCRWAIGEDQFPSEVTSIAGRFGYDDDGETPNTQVAFLKYDKVPIVYVMQGLGREKGSKSLNAYKGVRTGIVIECENGYFAGGKGGGWVYDNNDKKVKQFIGDGGKGHHANFFKAMRSRKVSDLNADVREGYLSSCLCHLACIPDRVGALTTVEKIKESISSEHPEVGVRFEEFQKHLAANEVDLTKVNARLGPKLKIDQKAETYIGAAKYNDSYWANQLLARTYREPFVVRDQV